jgi:putative methyltransferase
MRVGTDWHAWHEPYADATSSLSRRLRLVQRHIAYWLDERHGEALTVVSACAGQGHDVLGTLASRADADRVRATLLEYDERNVAAAQAAIDYAALRNVTVVRADAGDRAAYAGAVPADLVVMAGVFGNISDVEVRGTIAALPELCATDATVIWTRTRRAPDLTPAVRRWLAAAGFVEQDFHAPPDVLFSVGVHHFAGRPRPLTPRGRLFRFLA